MIKKIDHIVITTENIDECISFYKKLGFEYKSDNNRYELFAGDFKINIHIKGSEQLPHAKNVKVGSSDLCFEVSYDIRDFKKSLEGKDIKIETGIVNRCGYNGDMESIYVRDYDGNLIEFCSYN